MRAHRIFASSLFLLAAVGIHGSASAQQQAGFAVNRFEPSESGSQWFVLESLDLRGHVRPAAGVVGEWGYRPLVIYNTDKTVRSSVVRNQVFVHPGLSLVLWDRLRIGASLPIQIFADGHEGALNGVTYSPPANQQSIGDVRLSADVRVFGQYGDILTGAIGLQASLPTGDAASYTGDKNVRLAPRALVAGELGMVVYAAKLGFQYRGRSESFGNSPIGSEFFFAGSAGLKIADKKLVVGPEIFGSTVVEGGEVFKTRTTPLEGLLGAHYTIGNDWRVGGALGTGLSRGYGTPVVRALLSVEWTPGIAPLAPTDRDKDGIFDNEDACIDVPGIKTDDPKTNGCPEPDTDKDGILDKNDACVDVPGIKTDDPKTNGCPSDRDKDGIIDEQDACPDVPGVKNADPTKNGCPPDTDGDGVLDVDDACPTVPGLKTTDPTTNGCPDPDRDKDTILNDQDACPDEPGKPDKDPKRNGCPKAFVQAGQIKILDQVKFATGSAAILPGKDSQEVLDAVVKVLKDHPEIKKLRIEGHTDNQGAAAMNKKLSAARAASVVKWLVAHGIPAESLTSEGFGQDKPLDKNDTPEGRKNNRRVEFHIADAPPAPAN